MNRFFHNWSGLSGLAFAVACFCGPVHAGQDDFTFFESDAYEVVFERSGEVRYLIGDVFLESESGTIRCDSAVWTVGKNVVLRGHAVIDNADLRLAADSIHFDLNTDEAIAGGERVELWSRPDSIFAVGTNVYMNRISDYIYMHDRPTVYLRYPDSANLVTVVADYFYYDGVQSRAEAMGDVTINSTDIATTSECAVLFPSDDVLDLYGDPVAKRGESNLRGEYISIISENRQISRIDVIDSAVGDFFETQDSVGVPADKSRLRGRRIAFDFDNGELYEIRCWGQAYSWYIPDDADTGVDQENEVSGDTIVFAVDHENLTSVSVNGGAMGKFLESRYTNRDSIVDSVGDSAVSITVIDTLVDTIDYQAQLITYDFLDSVINLTKHARVTSDAIYLEAHQVSIDTRTNVVYAYSADVIADTSRTDSTFTGDLQPNPIPVMLKDGNDVLYGDFLEYSIDTEKGRIVKSKSKYQTGFFYGKKLYREKKDVFYLEDGKYTTCDAAEPHFHFQSSRLKLIEGEKLIARPVVLSINRIPILAVPYYVFPLKKGRHSGWLPFTFGNIEKGDRYIRNVGYYWAASEYWDWQGAIDYYEQSSRVNFYSRVNYNKRYVFSGNVSGNYARQTDYSGGTANEIKATRWSMKAAHDHQFAPSFKVSASGQVQSDATYYQDFSANLSERLNRSVRSQVSFTKTFSKSVSVSGKLAHDENLDAESRTDQIPSLSIRLPALKPFGSGSRDENGQAQMSWYNNLVMTYRPSILGYSSRTTSFVVDTATSDTTRVRSRKKYGRINHDLTASFPLTIARYINFNPSASYQEEWFQIYQTDQSEDKGIDPGNYRAYKWSAGASLKTNIYGTVYPKMLGLLGLRQTITPSVSYRFTPEIDRHPEVRSFAGGSAGSSTKSQSLSFSVTQLYQAKVKAGEGERNLNLVSISSGFNYNIEAETKRFSNLTTTINSTLLPKVNFYGTLVHDLYKPNSDELSFFSPYLQSFSLNASLRLSGQRFIFDDVMPTTEAPPPVDPGSDPNFTGDPTAPTSTGRQGWSLTATYSYRESGRGSVFTKSSNIRFSLAFNLTPQTAISYSQYYDISKGVTVNNQVGIERKLHCWTGNLFWVPIGSNRGWGFKLYVNALPQLKIDQSQNQLGSGYLQSLR